MKNSVRTSVLDGLDPHATVTPEFFTIHHRLTPEFFTSHTDSRIGSVALDGGLTSSAASMAQPLEFQQQNEAAQI